MTRDDRAGKMRTEQRALSTDEGMPAQTKWWSRRMGTYKRYLGYGISRGGKIAAQRYSWDADGTMSCVHWMCVRLFADAHRLMVDVTTDFQNNRMIFLFTME